MNKVRSYLKKYREPFYLCFFLPQFLCVSWGLGSGEGLYRLVFAAGLPFLCLSMLGEEYSLRDIIKMAAFGALVLWAFFQNRNRSLILACMAVFGAKNIDVRKILKYTFWILSISILLKTLSCAVGILPNKELELPKENGVRYTIYSYGYDTPNNLYFHLVIAVLLGMVLYGEKFSWLKFGSVFLIMYGAYQILISRTGWICFLAAALLYLMEHFLKRFSLKAGIKWTGRLMVCSVVGLCALDWGLIYLWKSGYSWLSFLNSTLNNRIVLAYQAFQKIGISFLGSRGAVQLDMLYATMLLNYGLLLSVLCIYGYTRLLYRMYREKEGMFLIALTVIALYSFMEVNAINPMWNPFLLLLAGEIFTEKAEVVERGECKNQHCYNMQK